MAEQEHSMEQEQHSTRLVGGDRYPPRELVSYYSKIRLPEEVKEKLKGSGFEFMFEVKHTITHIKSLLAALIGAYDTSTGVFHVGRNDLYFGFEDVLMITGLSIDGKPVILEANTRLPTDEESFGAYSAKIEGIMIRVHV